MVNTLAKQTKIQKDVEKHHSLILEGTMLAIDPASISAGYAMFDKGELVESGTLHIDPKIPTPLRLNEMFHIINELPTPDVFCVEQILKRKKTSKVLFWAVGITVGASYCPNLIEVPVPTWKRWAGPNHVKTDENDAIAIGSSVISLAKELKHEHKEY